MQNKIKIIELWSLIITIILSSFIGTSVNIILSKCKTDAWIAILLCFILFIPSFLIFKNIFNYKEDIPINKKIELLFGKKIGAIINTFLILASFINATCYLYSFTNFIKEEYLSNTPLFIITISFIILVIYANLKGIKTIARLSFILLIFNFILLIIPIFNVSSINEFNNLKPILESGLNKPFITSLKIIIININNIFMLTIIPKSKIINNQKINKYILSGIIISLIFMTLIIIITITSLGVNLALIYQYPEYIVLKKVNLFNFFNRAENILIIEWINGSFISLCFIVYFITNIVDNGKNKYIISIISLLILLASLWMFKNITEFNYFIENKLIIIKAITFLIFIIMSILIVLKTKKKIFKNIS